MSALIAIVGRPNVGKSALFNRIVGKRIAIVHDEPGVTRDRISVEAEWGDRSFTLVDTGGLGLVRGEKTADTMTRAAIAQVQLAIEAADVIILVVNVQEGVVALDREVASKLRRSGKPIVVAVNKVDHYRAEGGIAEFAALGFEELLPVSAIHGEGISELMEAAIRRLPEKAALPIPDSAADELSLGSALKLALVGRPNVGKSSIINSLTQSERVIVTPIPGTTRDSVDVPLEVTSGGIRERYTLIDTAGMRAERRVHDSVEFYSVKRTEDSIARCDIAIFVLDAEAGITTQDKKVADKIVSERKACIVVINKWDLVETEVRKAREQEIQRREEKRRNRDGPEPPLTMLSQFGNWVQEQLFFLDYAPVIFTSAQSGFNLDRLLEAVRYVAAQLRQKIPTALLNRTIADAIERRQPVSAAGHRLKFFYATQVRQAPPTFLLFVNRDELFSDAYRKHLIGALRKAFGYEGCPLIIVPKPRPKTIEPKRRFSTPHPSRQRTNRR